MDNSFENNNIMETAPLPNLRRGKAPDISDLDDLIAPERAGTPGIDLQAMSCDAGVPVKAPLSWNATMERYNQYQEWLRTTPPFKSGLPFDKDVELRPGYFVIVGARPTVGKTAFMLQLARVYARTSKVIFFTLEDGIERVVSRMMLSNDVYGIESNLMFSEEASLDGIEMTIKAYKPDIVFIDQLSKVRLSQEFDQVRLRFLEVTNRLQPFARDNNCMVVISVQESRVGKTLPAAENASFKESGSIEEDADVLMVLRATIDGKDNCEVMGNERTLHITKTRIANGDRGSYKLFYDKKTGQFIPLSDHYNPVVGDVNGFLPERDDDVPFDEGKQQVRISF